MKITIYELLGMVKDGKAPKKVKWRDKIWTYDNYKQDYVINDTDLLGYGFCNHRTLDFINDEVEILEEEKKIPEKLSTWFSLEKDCENDNIQYANNNFKTMYEKINEICDYLKSKGDE